MPLRHLLVPLGVDLLHTLVRGRSEEVKIFFPRYTYTIVDCKSLKYSDDLDGLVILVFIVNVCDSEILVCGLLTFWSNWSRTSCKCTQVSLQKRDIICWDALLEPLPLDMSMESIWLFNFSDPSGDLGKILSKETRTAILMRQIGYYVSITITAVIMCSFHWFFLSIERNVPKYTYVSP